MTTNSAALDGLRRHADQRSKKARRQIEKALADLFEQGAEINVNAVARTAGVTRKTVYNHTDLLERIKVQAGKLPKPHAGIPLSAPLNSLVESLRNELADQAAQFNDQIADLHAGMREREQELAAAHSEIRRITQQLAAVIGMGPTHADATGRVTTSVLPPQRDLD